MLKITQAIVTLCLCNIMSAFSVFGEESSLSDIDTQWDFDHGIQFRELEITPHYFQLEVIPNNKVKFERLATFLLRKSYRLCGGYHYKIEMIQGVEGFDDKRAMPNYIFSSLVANIEC